MKTISTSMGDISIVPQNKNVVFVHSAESMTIRGIKYTFRTWARNSGYGSGWDIPRIFPPTGINFIVDRVGGMSEYPPKYPSESAISALHSTIVPQVIEWLNTTEGKIAVCQAHLAHMQDKISQSNKNLENKKKEISDLENSISNATSECDLLQQEIHELIHENF